MSKYVKLKDISLLIGSGITPSRTNKNYWEEGTIPWLKTEQLGEYKIYETSEKITQQALEETSIKVFPINTLSVAMYGEGRTRGNVSILKNEMTTNQACCNIVLDEEKADYEYVYYYLKTQYLQLRSLSSGVRKNLNSNDIKEFEIRLPEDIVTQQKIASVLSSLDAKIELNNRINAELEAMAKTLYDYWFVQFDFPNTEGKPYKSSGGAMVWSEELKREIPEGWEVKKLRDIEANIVTGKTPPTDNKDNFNGSIPFITIGDIRGNIHILNTTNYLSTQGAECQKNKFLPKGSLCVSCIATIGLVGFTTEQSQTNQQINSIIFDKAENRYYLYFALIDYFQFSNGAKTGNTFANMNKDDFSSILLYYPEWDVLTKFDKEVDNIFNQILNNQYQNQQLAQLRDWLLPMLMNGQVVVE